MVNKSSIIVFLLIIVGAAWFFFGDSLLVSTDSNGTSSGNNSDSNDFFEDIGGNDNDSSESNQDEGLDDSGPVGSLRHEYLQEDYDVIIEIDYVDGNEPLDSSIDAMDEIFSTVANKDVIFSGGNKIDTSDNVYSNSDIRHIEDSNRDNYSDDSTVVLYVLFLNGRHSDSGTLGITYSASSFAVFPDRLDDAVTSLVTYSNVEKAVTVHELGHIFGLVNIGYESDRDHEDSSYLGHSSSKDSVMYWAVEDISVNNVFSFGPPTEFDNDDLFDLQKIISGEY